MRDIKFRGLSICKKQWVYGFYNYTFEADYFSQSYDDVPPRCHYIFTETTYFEVYPESVGQYTGLNDMDGKEIYEGDILHDDENYRWQVMSVDGGWVIECLEMPGLQCLTMTKTKYYKIIGNIYENPELIK